MAYDERLAERVREALKGRKGITEKKMFGGVAFMLDGKMFVGVQKDEIMARVGPAQHNSAIARKHARSMDFTGKPMVGFVYIAAAGVKNKVALVNWIEMCLDYVKTVSKKK